VSKSADIVEFWTVYKLFKTRLISPVIVHMPVESLSIVVNWSRILDSPFCLNYPQILSLIPLK